MSPIEFGKLYNLRKILTFGNDSEITDRLYDLGFIEGMELTVEKRLPLGGAWILSANSLYVALRDDEFKHLELA